MKPILTILFCFLLALSSFLSAQSVSVIIPCTYKHFYLLPELLDALELQSRQPDEVVISLSEAHRVGNGKLSDLQARTYSFSLKLLTSHDVQYAGINRNIAAENSSGDILITQDADDLPHPQRVEIICYFLKKTRADHLMHLWYPSQDMIAEMSAEGILKLPRWTEYYSNFDSIKLRRVRTQKQRSKISYLHNGNIGLLKSLFEKIKWPGDKKAQDVKFNEAVLRSPNKSYVVLAPLVIYRNKLSSHNSIL